MESNSHSEFICETDPSFSHFRITSERNGRNMSQTKKFELIQPKILEMPQINNLKGRNLTFFTKKISFLNSPIKLIDV